MTSEYLGVRPFVAQLLHICGGKSLSGWITEHLLLNYLVNVKKKNCLGFPKTYQMRTLGVRHEKLQF